MVLTCISLFSVIECVFAPMVYFGVYGKMFSSHLVQLYMSCHIQSKVIVSTGLMWFQCKYTAETVATLVSNIVQHDI